MKIPPLPPLSNSAEEVVRQAIIAKLEFDPEFFLAEYTRQFANVLNADSAATLFSEYNDDPARYRVAVHPAAQWIRDELFRRWLTRPGAPGKNRVVFTAGGNASGKSSAIAFAQADLRALVVFDSTFSNPEHAQHLINLALAANKAVSVLYVNRPLDDALQGMIERADTEGRIVTIDQLIGSQRGAASTVQGLWREFGQDPRFTFTFLYNSAEGISSEVGLETATPQDYTESRGMLNELLDIAYKSGRIAESSYKRIRGSGREPGEPYSRPH